VNNLPRVEMCMEMDINGLKSPCVPLDSRGNGNKDVVQNGNGTGINVTRMEVAFSQRHLQSSYIISNFRFLHM